MFQASLQSWGCKCSALKLVAARKKAFDNKANFDFLVGYAQKNIDYCSGG